jgi:hypothetical protein
MRKFLLHPFWLMVVPLMLFNPGEACALQVHGEPEGLYVHQIAHLHYIFALGYFYWDIRRTSFTGRGWGYLQMFCLLMTCWNLMAFIGHIAGAYLHPTSLVQKDHYLTTLLLEPFTLTKYIYYVTKLDHLIYVPAMFCLFIGLRSFYHSVAQEDLGGQR